MVLYLQYQLKFQNTQLKLIILIHSGTDNNNVIHTQIKNIVAQIYHRTFYLIVT